MTGRPTPLLTTIKARVPVGFDGMWSVMLLLHREKGVFTLTQILDHTPISRATVHDYLRRLKAGGYLELAGKADTANLYRLIKTPRQAPRLRRDGSRTRPALGQDQMWRTMKMLSRFSASDLRINASTDVCEITTLTAKSYIKHLYRAGYLQLMQASQPGKPAHYRLKPGMNTGPRAPQVMRTKFVWDANLKAVMGDPSDAEESS